MGKMKSAKKSASSRENGKLGGRPRTLPPTKRSILLAHMKAGEWDKALSLASKFPNLGPEKEAITRAHNARLRPDFYRQIKQDPVAHFESGIAALKAKFLK